MATLTFDIDQLARLAQHAVDAPGHSYGYDVLFEPEYHRGGKVVKKNGWPDKDNIDESKLTPALILVKDQGVYFMSNGKPAPDQTNDGHVAYAKEADPKALPFDEWYEAGRRIMGGDDTVITMFGWPQVVLKAQAEGATEIRLNVTSESIEIEPAFPNEPRGPTPRG